MFSASYCSAGSLAELRDQTLPPSLLIVAVLMASIPLENSTVLPAIGSISRLLGVLATGAVVIDAAVALGFRRPHVAHLPLALFVIWSAWTFFWSFDPKLTSERITTNLQLLAMVWLIWQSVRELRLLRIVLQGFVLGSCFAAILTVIKSRGLDAIDAIRFSGAGADPNELGLVMVLTIPMAYYLSATAPTRLSRLLWLSPMPLYIVGVVLTVSRGAFITTVVALLGISIWHVTSSSRMRLAPLIAGVLLLALGLFLMPKASLERIGTIESEISTGRIGKRMLIWSAGMELFRERPMTGIGAATFSNAVQPLLGRDLAAHNVYVSVLTETGIIGFLIFSLALITCFITAMHLDSSERALWLMVMVIWCIGVMSLTWEYKKVTWSLFGLLIASASTTGNGLGETASSVMPGTRTGGLIRK